MRFGTTHGLLLNILHRFNSMNNASDYNGISDARRSMGREY